MTRRCKAMPGLVVVAGGWACTPELEPIEWDPVDIDALHQAIANPTGVVDEASANEVASLILVREPAYRLLSDYLASVFRASGSGHEPGQPIWLRPWALDGTSVYVLVACPGALDDPYANPFADGLMRIDSPTLTAELLETDELDGQLRLGFERCRIGDYEFDGTAIAFRGPDDLGLVPAIRYAIAEQAFELTEPLLWRSFDQGSALFELDSEQTLVLDWSVADAELSLRGRNGALVCEIRETGLDCQAP